MTVDQHLELYESDLICLTEVLHSLEDLAKIEGLFSCEIRVKVDDVGLWVVIGWGEVGEPAVLRFERDVEPLAKEGPKPAQGAIYYNP